MLNDIFMEYLIKKKPGAKEILIKVGIVVAALFLTVILLGVLFALTQSGIPAVFSIGFLLIALMWYVAILLMGKLNLEFEYTLTNSEIDIDKIMSKRGRKRIASFDFKNIYICANIRDNMHKHDYENTELISKTFDVSGDKSRGGVYFVDYEDEKNGRTRILFQPPQKMLDSIKRFNPRCVFLYEE